MSQEPTSFESGADLTPEEVTALAEWKQLLEAGETDVLLRTASRRLLDLVEPAIRAASEAISTPALDVSLVARCVVKRAFDTANTIANGKSCVLQRDGAA